MSAPEQKATPATIERDPCSPTIRAVLMPTAWAVLCPVCGAETEINQLREDDAGAICADGTDMYFYCEGEGCGAFLEVGAVTVQEAYPA